MYASIVLYQHRLIDIQETLDSLLSSQAVNKIILVDNGGCDWAKDLADERLIYLPSPKNGGFGYGHNLAIQHYAKDSEFFLICNPDVYFDGEQLDELVGIAKQRPEGLFSPTILYPDGSNQHGQRLLPTPINLFARRLAPWWAEKLDDAYLLRRTSFTDYHFVANCSGCFMLFRASALLELGGFDERYFMYLEDIDLSRRCAARFGNCYVPRIAV